MFNNASYGDVLRDRRTVYEGREIGSSLTNPDFVKLAESFGAAGYLVKTPALLKAALERAFAQTGPVLIEVRASPVRKRRPGRSCIRVCKRKVALAKGTSRPMSQPTYLVQAKTATC